MMRSPRFFAVACRTPDGEIVVKHEEVDKSVLRKLKWLNRPFLRGTLALLDSMILGSRALSFASSVQLPGVTSSRKAGDNPGDTTHTKTTDHSLSPALASAAASVMTGVPEMETAPEKSKISDIAIGGTIAFSLLFGFVVFRLIPTALTELGDHFHLLGASSSRLKLNAVDGAIRASFFFGYILLISRLAGIRAVFQYHGAEHKAINTLEAGLPLTQENALAASRIHPRCGTSFLIVVMAIDFLVCLFLPRPFIVLRVLLHIAVLFPVAGLSYEVIKFAGKHRKNALVMAAFAPGMWTQYLTTREPNADQVDVALAALYAALEAEGHSLSTLKGEIERKETDPAAALA